MRVITISREFGSGGRELGKRLADQLGFDYYDRQIISSIANTNNLDEDYVERTLEQRSWATIPYSFRHSFAMSAVIQPPQIGLLQAQREVIEGIVGTGRDCVVVGRNADVFLEKQRPFKIFVCAAMEARVARCIERASEDEQLTPRQIEQNIRRIDKNRAKTREMIAFGKWGDPASYDLTVNTTNWDIKALTPAVADFALRWFEQRG